MQCNRRAVVVYFLRYEFVKLFKMHVNAILTLFPNRIRHNVVILVIAKIECFNANNCKK